MASTDDPSASVADELESWLRTGTDHRLGALADLFGERAFAVLFIVLLAVPALPLPTGGATHVFEIIATLLALELIAGRRKVWLPERFKRKTFDPDGRTMKALLKTLRFLERHSRPRWRGLIDSRPGRTVFGVAVLIGSVAAFLAPPFSGLDTIPSIGVVLVSAGALVGDSLLFALGIVLIGGGVVVDIVTGKAALKLIGARAAGA